MATDRARAMRVAKRGADPRRRAAVPEQVGCADGSRRAPQRRLGLAERVVGCNGVRVLLAQRNHQCRPRCVGGARIVQRKHGGRAGGALRCEGIVVVQHGEHARLDRER
eukprot:4080077-Prymnesium_polylepis.2